MTTSSLDYVSIGSLFFFFFFFLRPSCALILFSYLNSLQPGFLFLSFGFGKPSCFHFISLNGFTGPLSLSEESYFGCLFPLYRSIFVIGTPSGFPLFLFLPLPFLNRMIPGTCTLNLFTSNNGEKVIAIKREIYVVLVGKEGLLMGFIEN
jgi:hypothetical protein